MAHNYKPAPKAAPKAASPKPAEVRPVEAPPVEVKPVVKVDTSAQDVKDKILANAKGMLTRGEITQRHYDAIAANLK